jgi:hypothetical protein
MHVFSVRAWVRGNLFGRLQVSPGCLTFTPGLTARKVALIDGSLIHRDRRVTAAGSDRFGLGTVSLQTGGEPDTMVRWSINGATKLTSVNISPWPWQRKKLLNALRAAGFEVTIRSGWTALAFWRPLT